MGGCRRPMRKEPGFKYTSAVFQYCFGTSLPISNGGLDPVNDLDFLLQFTSSNSYDVYN
jgi:hypothetical protein